MFQKPFYIRPLLEKEGGGGVNLDKGGEVKTWGIGKPLLKNSKDNWSSISQVVLTTP